MNKQTIYTHRFLARIVMETITPLVVGNGEKDITTDALVATDVNGLPYIPGTALAGIIRHAIDAQNPQIDNFGRKCSDLFFGYQETNEQRKYRMNFEQGNGSKSEENISIGSNIIFTDAKMIGENNEPIDGLQPIDWNDDFFAHYKELPIRQHVKINGKGATGKGGKFDEQIVYKGTRFCFELEMVSDGNNADIFTDVLTQLQSETFRIGGGTRSGFGRMKIISCQIKILNLEKSDDLLFYLQKSSSISEGWDGKSFEEKMDTDWIKYELKLKPEDFFLFGSGFGDGDVDMTPVKEDCVDWSSGKPKFKKNAILIPATSVKGALSHRVAFYFNKLNNVFADGMGKEEMEDHIGKNNEAVKLLFGSEGERKGNKMINQLRGNVIFSDIIETEDVKDKILNHVSIDCFTGGAIASALFTEKTTYGKGKEFNTTILVKNGILDGIKDKEGKSIGNDVFESALKDICKGQLPLGGGVNRGNGCFSGVLKRESIIIYPKDGGNE
jgi:CRISPR/Cas system CSM-associated protein Csm3 (group 7 of RAMP superfamily)